MRVLVVKLSSLGDIIHTLPALSDARQVNKDLVFDWVVEENFVEVPGWHPAVDRVIPIAIRRWRRNLVRALLDREVRAFRQAIQRVHYDLVIDAQGLIKSGIVSRLSRGITIGLSSRTIREPVATLFYNKVYSVPWTEHPIDRVRQLFSRALQYRYERAQIDYGIDVGRVTGKAARRTARQVVFLHGTTWKTKHWPDYYWRELAEIAAGKGYRVLLPWGDDREKRRAHYIAADNARASVLERQTLTELARKIQDSTGVIGVDTGLGHLAVALARPTVSLYGPTNPGRSDSVGPRQLHLVSNLDCAPCVKKVCRYRGPPIIDASGTRTVTPACFASHEPAAVWRRFEELVQPGQG